VDIPDFAFLAGHTADTASHGDHGGSTEKAGYPQNTPTNAETDPQITQIDTD
jgi:hypothetical protein